MPASKLNYIVLYKGDSQVYGASSEKVALSSPPPEGVPLEDKRVLFISMRPDTGELVVHQIPQDQVMEAEIVEKKKKKKET